VVASSCHSCRFYEESGVWRKGWCRNPKLYAPHESHPVDAAALDCKVSWAKSYWAPADLDDSASPYELARPVHIGEPGAGATIDSVPGGEEPMAPGPVRPGTSEERTVSYQPEERYWTDYLRIALPVVGLLLLIGLLWYWASALIGDGGDQPPQTPEQAAVITPVNESTPPPPTPTAVVIAPTPGPPEPTPTPVPAVAPSPTPPPTQAPAVAAPEENPCANLPVYPVDSLVTTTDTVNLRPTASTDQDPIAELAPGTQLRITGSFQETGQCDWWPVAVVDSGQTGFVREDFLQAVQS
jgi:hypothetical protein